MGGRGWGWTNGGEREISGCMKKGSGKGGWGSFDKIFKRKDYKNNQCSDEEIH